MEQQPPIHLLATYSGLDLAGHDMLGRLSHDPRFKVYIATIAQPDRYKMQGDCIPLIIPPIRSKFNWDTIKALHKHLREHDIDIIFSPGSSGLSNALFASLGTKALNVAYRGTQAKIRRTDPTYYLAALNPRVAHTVCETEDIREYLSRFISPRKLSVNLKPFDLRWLDDALRNPKPVEGLPEDALTCIYVGRCKGRPFKGLSSLLQAMHLLDDPRLHLVFIGDYDDSDYHLATSGPASSRIHLLGYQMDALRYLPQRDIFVLPSWRDASPRAVREAMACGIPCIVSDIPGARDLVIDGTTGILFPKNDPQALAEALRRLIDHPEERKRMGEAGKERIIRDFSPEIYAQNFKNLFISLLSQ